jgi:hypothetical protein
MLPPLDPLNLTPAASLNRVRLVALPGIALPPHVAGVTAYELLSAPVIAGWVRQHAGPLGLTDLHDADTDVLLRGLDRSFSAPDPAIRAAAELVARRFGQHLGYLLLTLRRGDAESRAARPDWDASYWAHWAGVTTIHLGGGLVSGQLGPRLIQHAARTIAESGMSDCALRLAPWPAFLPLIGAARSIWTGDPDAMAVVCDFGQSRIKRACARYERGVLTNLRLLPTLPARWTSLTHGVEPTPGQVERLADHLVAIAADTLREVSTFGRGVAPIFTASIASYLHDGQPLARQGGPYSYLAALAPRLADWLAARLTDQLGHPLAVTLLHDGTAAALTYAVDANTAVITLGTALGIGFVPATATLRPISTQFAIL